MCFLIPRHQTELRHKMHSISTTDYDKRTLHSRQVATIAGNGIYIWPIRNTSLKQILLMLIIIGSMSYSNRHCPHAYPTSPTVTPTPTRHTYDQLFAPQRHLHPVTSVIATRTRYTGDPPSTGSKRRGRPLDSRASPRNDPDSLQTQFFRSRRWRSS